MTVAPNSSASPKAAGTIMRGASNGMKSTGYRLNQHTQTIGMLTAAVASSGSLTMPVEWSNFDINKIFSLSGNSGQTTLPTVETVLDETPAAPSQAADLNQLAEKPDMPTEKDYIDAKIDGVRSELRADVAELRATVQSGQAAMEARQSALETKMDALTSLIQTKPDKLTIWGSSLAVAGIVIAAIAFGGDRFDAGVGFSDHLTKQQQVDAAQSGRIDQQDAKLAEIDNKLDRVLTALEKQPPAPPQQ